MSLFDLSQDLSRDLARMSFAAPAAYVYDPTSYAVQPLRLYLERWARSPRVLLLGMNPGPWGMAQTGVPFGSVPSARGFLGVEAEVGKPELEHPKRPVQGFSCSRVEVSGARLWGWAEDTWGSPERFFEGIFVANYCPLLFLEEGGRNLTPDRLPATIRKRLELHCDAALVKTVEKLGVELAIGIGTFAEKRLRKALEGRSMKIGRILHPSPASPAANRGWAEVVTSQMRALGVEVPG